MGVLYLLPSILGESETGSVIPEGVLKILISLDHFIVENVRTARRFLIKAGYRGNIDDITFYVLDEHTGENELSSFLVPCKKGIDVGLLSEAGVPAVADPGSGLILLAHKSGIRVVPLTGPSSILLALMSSGLNGQSFSFLGYLPVRKDELAARIKEIESRSLKEKQTIIFIETPYRNMKLFDLLIRTCRPATYLCLATDLTTPGEKVVTKSISDWKKTMPDLDRKPTVFLINASFNSK